MHIIFGEAIKEIPNSFTVLELDTISTNSTVVTAYCVVEKIPLQEFPLIDAHIKLHADVIDNYRNQHWEYCEKAIEALLGKWNGEVDSFYQTLLERIKTFKETPPPADWTGIVTKLD
jgi:hypothetical protein